jgi:hypothetical protein
MAQKEEVTEITLPYKWKPRLYQEPLWNYFQGDATGKRAVCVWHRRAGKDLLAMNLIGTKVFERVGVYWHLLPTHRQGRAIVWNGFTREGRRFLDHFPKQLVERTNEHEMRIHFTNGSIYQVIGTDESDRLVGTNPVGCVFSEYSLQDPSAWNYIRPILAENGGWALFIYTPRSMNHGWRMLQDAQSAGWFVDIRKAGSGDDSTKRPDGTPVISDQQIEDERKAGMAEELIQQEFYVSFQTSLVGAYYSKAMDMMRSERRICNVPYDPRLQVNTYWDIGVKDSTVILFVQLHDQEIRLIDLYENSGEGLAHYIKIIKEKPYVYGSHYAPWDIEVRDFSSGKARIEVAKNLGVKLNVTPQHSVEDGIEQVRNILPLCWIDQDKCRVLVDALNQYRKEPLSDHLQPTGFGAKQAFKEKPVHDWTSHFADCVRILAWNYRRRHRYGLKRPQEKALDTFQYV